MNNYNIEIQILYYPDEDVSLNRNKEESYIFPNVHNLECGQGLE